MISAMPQFIQQYLQKHELMQFFFFLVWILAISLGCFKKWKIHQSFVITDLSGKEVNDLAYANKLLSYLIQHFFNITKVNVHLKHNSLQDISEGNFALKISSCPNVSIKQFRIPTENYKAIYVPKLNIFMQKSVYQMC